MSRSRRILVSGLHSVVVASLLLAGFSAPAHAEDTPNDGWRLLYNPPVVSLFSGAATYSHPIDVPEGRGGIQPSLNLSYNSRRVDGVLDYIESGWAGLGWSIDLMDITREGVKTSNCSGGTGHHVEYTDDFSLMMNGTSYELYPANSEQQHGRYYAKDGPQLYIERRNDLAGNGSVVNKTGEYWIVRGAGGTEYRLGYEVVSEQVVAPVCGSQPYGGSAESYAVYRWRLDWAEDVHGNAMKVAYEEPQGGCSGTPRDTSSLFDRIYYNNYGQGEWLTEINFVHDEKGGPYSGQPGCSSRLFGAQDDLKGIEIYQDGERAWYYQLQHENTFTPANSRVRRLVSIRRFSGDGTSSYPATTLGYTWLDNKWSCAGSGVCDPYDAWANATFSYPRLSWVNNGYGASTAFTYQNDGRTDWYIPYSYRVTETRTDDGIHTQDALLTYTYGTACYNQSGNDKLWGTRCASRNSPSIGTIGGYNSARVKYYSYGGTLISQQLHRYYTEDGDEEPWRHGKEYQRDSLDSGGTLLVRQATTWVEGDVGGVATIALADQVVSTQYGGGESFVTKEEYEYDEYGSLTARYEYGDINSYNEHVTTWSEYVNVGAPDDLLNGGFEAGLPGSWGVWQNPTLEASTKEGEGRNGDYALRLRREGDGSVYQILGGLVAGHVYTVTMWARSEPGTPEQALKFVVRDPAGGNQQDTGWLTPPASWTPYSLQYVANESGNIRIAFRYTSASDEATVYVDDVSITKSWMVGLESREAVYAGIVADPETADAETETITWYDHQSTWGDSSSVTKGLPTKVGAGLEGHATEPFVTTEYTYDDRGNVVATTDANGNTSTVDYDDSFDWIPVQACNSLAPPQCVTTAYYGIDNGTENGLWGQVKSVTDANDVSTEYLYDDLGRLTTVMRPGDSEDYPSLEYTYNDGPAPFSIVASAREVSGTAESLVVKTYYDGMGRQLQTLSEAAADAEQPWIVSGHTDYDALGRAVKAYAPEFAPNSTYRSPEAGWVYTESEYDALGRVTKVTEPDGTETRNYYELDFEDPNVYVPNLTGGCRRSTVDGNGHAKHYVTDGFGRMAVVREFTGSCYPGGGCDPGDGYEHYASTSYEYDVLGNLRDVYDGADNHTHMEYDALGRKTEMEDPDMGDWSYTYDAVGNLQTQTDGAGCTTAFAYDEINRLTGKTYSGTCAGTPAVTYSHDESGHGYSEGRRTSMADGSGSTAWTYDARGRVGSETKVITGAPGPFATSYDYDAMDRVVTTTYPDGEAVTSEYDESGQAEGLSSDLYGDYVTDIDRNATGQITALSLDSGVTSAYEYDPLDFRLEHYAVQGPLEELLDFEYVYDPVGNVLQIIDDPEGRATWPESGFDFEDQFDSKWVDWIDEFTYHEGFEHRNRPEWITGITFRDEFNTANHETWNWDVNQTVPYNYAGENVAKNTGVHPDYANFHREPYSLTHGEGLQLRFNVDVLESNAHFSIESNDGTYRRFGVRFAGEDLVVQYNNGSGWVYPKTLFSDPQHHTWYVLRIAVDDVNGFFIDVYQENDPAVRNTYRVSMAGGRQWRFHSWNRPHWRKGGSAYIDEYEEFTFTSINTSETQDWAWSHYQKIPVTFSGNEAVRSRGTGNSWDASFWHNSHNLSDGEGVQLRFRADRLDSLAHFSIESNNGTYRRFGLRFMNNQLIVQYNEGGGYMYPQTLIASPSINTWYVARIAIDDTDGFFVEVWQESDPSVRGTYSRTMPAGLGWRFRHWNYRGNAYVDDYEEFTFEQVNASEVTDWVWGSHYQTVPYSDGGENVVRNAGTGANYNATFYRSSHSLTDGDGLQLRFRVDADDSNAHLAVESNDGTYRRFGVIARNGGLDLQYNEGSGYVYPGILLADLAGDTWYVLRFVVDDSPRGFYVEVFQEDNPSVQATYRHAMPAGQDWRFRHWVHTGNSYIDDYREFDASNVWTGQSQHFSYDHLDRLTHAETSGGGQGHYERSYSYDEIGNMLSKTGVGSYTYGDTAHVHAVTSAGDNSYVYDPNGNMTSRMENGVNYKQTFDVNNRLERVEWGDHVTTFTYDGDGNRVMKDEDGVVTYYIGGIYELQGTERTSYYYVAGQRIAMRVGAPGQAGTLTYLHGDHLGSTSLATDASGEYVQGSRTGYYPFGERRYGGGTGTDYGFTGQREEAYIDLIEMGARWYDGSIGRWLSADSIVPNPANPQSLNRYSYVYNNPLKYTDPDGHFVFLALLAVGVVGGLIGGAVYGYGHQVVENLDEGMELGEALTTNIDPVEVGGFTGVGGVIGGLVGGGLWVAEQLATAAGLKLTEWILRHPKLAEALGIATTVVTNELMDADDDEVRTINWLADNLNKVSHILDPKHAWDRLVDLTGQLQQDYLAIQPYIEQALKGTGTKIYDSILGPVMRYTTTIGAETVTVNAITLHDGTIMIENAWVNIQ
jgi:RHS repeat-associated protein